MFFDCYIYPITIIKVIFCVCLCVVGVIMCAFVFVCSCSLLLLWLFVHLLSVCVCSSSSPSLCASVESLSLTNFFSYFSSATLPFVCSCLVCVFCVCSFVFVKSCSWMFDCDFRARLVSLFCL